MKKSDMSRTISKIAFVGITGILLAGILLSSADHDVPIGVEGLRCDSCGRECSVVCGSRQFRTCCFNYIKKRGDPSFTGISSSGAQNFRPQTKPGGKDTEESMDVPSAAYVLAGPHVYISEVDPLLRQFAQVRRMDI